jgi:hypothetical protein
MIYENGCSIKSVYVGLRCHDLTNDEYDVFRRNLLDGSFFDSFRNRNDWAERFRMTTDDWNADLVEMCTKLQDTGEAWVRIIPMLAEFYKVNIVVLFAVQSQTYSCEPENSPRLDFTITQGHVEYIPTSPLRARCKQLYDELHRLEELEQEVTWLDQLFGMNSDSDSDWDFSYLETCFEAPSRVQA